MNSFLASFKRLLPKKHFARSVTVLAGGTFGAQAITILVAPILTRLYLPDEYGMMALFGSLLSIITVVVCLRYEFAIPLPREDKDAAALLVLSSFITCCLALLTSLIIFFLGRAICQTLNAPTLFAYLWLMPIGVILVGIYQILNYWAIRTGSFSLIAKSKLSQALGGAAVQLLGYRFGAMALIGGLIAGQAAGITRLGSWIPRSDLFKKINFNNITNQAQRYKHFPAFSAWAGLFNAASAALPSIFITSFFGLAAAGLFALTNRVLGAPSILIGQAIGQVYMSEAAIAHRNGNLPELVAQVHYNLAQIAMPATFILILIAPNLVSFFFGENWRQSGVFLQYLAPMFYIQFVLSPLSTTVEIMERQAIGMKLQFIMLAARLIALLIGASSGNLVFAVILYSLFSSVSYAIWLFVVIHITQNQLPTFILPTIKAFKWALIVCIPLLGTIFINFSLDIVLYIAFPLSLFLYAIRMYYLFNV